MHSDRFKAQQILAILSTWPFLSPSFTFNMSKGIVPCMISWLIINHTESQQSGVQSLFMDHLEWRWHLQTLKQQRHLNSYLHVREYTMWQIFWHKKCIIPQSSIVLFIMPVHGESVAQCKTKLNPPTHSNNFRAGHLAYLLIRVPVLSVSGISMVLGQVSLDMWLAFGWRDCLSIRFLLLSTRCMWCPQTAVPRVHHWCPVNAVIHSGWFT